MNDTNLSRHYNFKDTYFAIIKCNNKKKYDKIFSFNKDRVKSVHEYNLYVQDLVDTVINHYYENFESENSYGVWLINNKLTTSSHTSIGSAFLVNLFKIRENYLALRYDFVLQLLKISKAIKKRDNK